MRRVGGKAVTIVVCDAGGSLLGSLGPFEVATPWWQDVEPIGRRFPALTWCGCCTGCPRTRAPSAAR